MMALQLVTAIAGKLSRRPLAVAVLLSLWMAMPVTPAIAQDADKSYSATVKVDATADSTAAAREAARIDGQRRALAAVIGRLSDSPETAKPPKLDDKAITDMVDSFEVANERMSAVRYVADYTFYFRPSKIRRLVRALESAAAEGAAKAAPDSDSRPIVVLPVFQDGARSVLWDDPNEWRLAWEQRAAGSARLTLPLGDAKDLAAIDSEKAKSGQSDALASIAQQNGASEAVVALATTRRPGGNLTGLDISLKRYRSGRLVDTQTRSFDANPGEREADFLMRAATSVAGEIEKAKTRSDQQNQQQASLTITVPISSLAEWLQLRNRLASIASIRKIDLLSLNRQEAKIEIRYVGTQDELKSSLSEAKLDLGGGDPAWTIQPAGPTSPR